MKRVLLACLLMLSCGPVRPPTPPSPPPIVTVREVQLTVWTPADPTATLVVDGTDTHPAWSAICSSTRLDAAGVKVICQLPADAPAPRGSHLRVLADGFDPGAVDFATIVFQSGVPISVQEVPGIRLKPAFVALVPWMRAGQFFRQVDGGRVTAIQASDFNVYNRFLNGENIDPVLEQRAALGYNLLRIFTAYNVCPPGAGCQEIGRLVPREHPEYYARIPEFLHRLARFQLRAEFVAFTGPYESLFANDDDKVAHWDRLIAAVSPETNAILELVNELDQAANANLPIARLRQPVGVLASHGSNGSQAEPVKPYWGYVTFHTNDAPEWVRKVGHNCWELSDGPCLANENTRSADHFTSNDLAFDAAAGAALLAGGSAFHSVHGKNSTLWSGLELENARAWANGAKSVPLTCQDGGYKHRDDLEGSAYLRVYQRGNDPACIVRIRP